MIEHFTGNFHTAGKRSPLDETRCITGEEGTPDLPPSLPVRFALPPGPPVTSGPWPSRSVPVSQTQSLTCSWRPNTSSQLIRRNHFGSEPAIQGVSGELPSCRPRNAAWTSTSVRAASRHRHLPYGMLKGVSSRMFTPRGRGPHSYRCGPLLRPRV